MERDIKPTYDELESYVENLQKQLADAQATIAALQADNRTYINERHDNMKQIEQLQAGLAERTAELEATKRKVDLAHKKAWLAAHDVGFFTMWNGTDHSGPPKLALLCNDTFAWATADAEDVLDEQIDTIVELFKNEGEAGVIKWIALQRNMKPMESVGKWLFGCDAIKKERDDLQAELERVRGQYADLRKMVLALPKVEGEIEYVSGMGWVIKHNGDVRAIPDLGRGLVAALLQHRQGMEGVNES